MSLQWAVTLRWRGQTRHEAHTPQGIYKIHQCEGRHHFPVWFWPAGSQEAVDIGWDEPWNLRQAKRQCEAHVRLGSPVPCDYDTLFAEVEGTVTP